MTSVTIVKETQLEKGAGRRPGRPISFDRDAALRRAMTTFWRHGYETTSVADLTAAMGVTAPSLYAAFGDKRRLFLEAVQLYAQGATAMSKAFENSPTSYAAALDMMVSAAVAYTGEDTPAGCLLASATASGSAASADVQQAVADVRRGVERLLRARIERDVAEGVLPAGQNAAALAGLVTAVTQGMSVLARDGVPRSSLVSIAEAAMAAWPAQPGGRPQARKKRSRTPAGPT